jgi:hypothetical protein
MKNSWRPGEIMNEREPDGFVLIRSDPRDPWACLFMLRREQILVMQDSLRLCEKNLARKTSELTDDRA